MIHPQDADLVLVPREPTAEMIATGYASLRTANDWTQIYAAMIAAAPQPPTTEVAGLREALDIDDGENELQEIADGAYGHNPMMRGLARDELARRAALSLDPKSVEEKAGPVATIVGWHTIRKLLNGEQVEHGEILLIPASDIMDGSRGTPEYYAEKAARDWAVAKWQEEVANRPLQNVHRRSLDTTWRQVIRHFGGDDEKILGPRHNDLIGSSPWEKPNAGGEA